MAKKAVAVEGVGAEAVDLHLKVNPRLSDLVRQRTLMPVYPHLHIWNCST